MALVGMGYEVFLNLSRVFLNPPRLSDSPPSLHLLFFFIVFFVLLCFWVLVQPAQLDSIYFNIYPLQARGRPGDPHRRSRAAVGLAGGVPHRVHASSPFHFTDLAADGIRDTVWSPSLETLAVGKLTPLSQGCFLERELGTTSERYSGAQARRLREDVSAMGAWLFGSRGQARG